MKLKTPDMASKTSEMKLLKITLLVIAALGLISSAYNAIYDKSIDEFLKGLIPAAVLIFIYLKFPKQNRGLNESNSQ